MSPIQTPGARAAWLIAALNSVEPYMISSRRSTSLPPARNRPGCAAGVIEMIDKRVSRLSDALGDKAYLDGVRSPLGDLMMTTCSDHRRQGTARPVSNLAAYKARCQASSAFQVALAAQIGNFEKREPVPAYGTQSEEK